MKTIKVLGTDCANCRKLERMVRDVVEKTNVDANVEKVDDIIKIIDYGVRRTPALVIDEKVIFYGRVPGEKELISLLTK